MGLILLVSETLERQLKVFFRVDMASPESINMVEWPLGHLGPYITLGMCLGGITSKTGFGGLFGLDFIGF